MQGSLTCMFCLAGLAIVCCFQVTAGTNVCEATAIKKCIGGYVAGFTQNTDMSDVSLHCYLDHQLLKCTEKALNQCGKTPTLLALGRAVLSYVVFDRKLSVCPRHGYRSLYYLLKTEDSFTDTSSWNYKINTLLHTSQYSRGARASEIKCLQQFVPKMKTTPDLCVNIPFKYNCIKEETKTCSSRILKDLLNVFPEEANKVLSVLCIPQDSG